MTVRRGIDTHVSMRLTVEESVQLRRRTNWLCVWLSDAWEPDFYALLFGAKDQHLCTVCDAICDVLFIAVRPHSTCSTRYDNLRCVGFSCLTLTWWFFFPSRVKSAFTTSVTLSDSDRNVVTLFLTYIPAQSDNRRLYDQFCFSHIYINFYSVISVLGLKSEWHWNGRSCSIKKRLTHASSSRVEVDTSSTC